MDRFFSCEVWTIRAARSGIHLFGLVKTWLFWQAYPYQWDRRNSVMSACGFDNYLRRQLPDRQEQQTKETRMHLLTKESLICQADESAPHLERCRTNSVHVYQKPGGQHYVSVSMNVWREKEAIIDQIQPGSMPLFGTERRDGATRKVNNLSCLFRFSFS